MRTDQGETTITKPTLRATPRGVDAPMSVATPWDTRFPALPRESDTGSFVARKITDTHTLARLVRATEQAVATVERTIQQAADDAEALRDTREHYVDLVFGQEVGFLFPDLAADEVELLVSLLKVRNAIGVLLNGLPQGQAHKAQAEPDPTAQDLQGEFVRLCQQVEQSGIEDRLDPLQRRVLRDEFLSIVLDKTSSTQLFFRRGAHGPASSARTPSCADGSGAQRILVLSHDRTEAEGIACWLGVAGYDTRVGAAGFEGCRFALQQEPHLVVLDFVSTFAERSCDSVLDGRTILQILRQILRGRSVPLIGLVHAADFEAQQQLTQAGAAACLRRPLDPHRLLTAAQTALATSSAALPVSPIHTIAQSA